MEEFGLLTVENVEFGFHVTILEQEARIKKFEHEMKLKKLLDVV